MTKLKDTVLREIREQGLSPTSKLFFITKNYFFWLLFVVCVVVGAISFSTILFELVIEGGPWRELSGLGRSGLFVQAIPIFWLLFLLVFTIAAWLNFKQIDGSHRRENAMIVLASILFSLLLGFLLFTTGLAEKIEDKMRETVPVYRVLTEKRLERKADYLESRDLDARALKLKREQLRTLCLNQGREDCFGAIDKLTDGEVNSELELKEDSELKEN